MRPLPRLLLVAAVLAAIPGLGRAEAPARKRVVVMVGLPGSGKTVLSEHLAGITGARRLSCGDVVRGWMREKGLAATPENDRLAANHFAALPGEVTRRIAAQITSSPQSLFIVDGVRRPMELKMLQEQFDVRVVAVRAPARLRYPRMLARHRFQNETVDYLRERDQREIKLGVLHVLRKPFVRLDGTVPLAELPSQARWLAAELARSFQTRP